MSDKAKKEFAKLVKQKNPAKLKESLEAGILNQITCEEMTKILHKAGKNSLNADLIVAMYAEAALCNDARNRLEQLNGLGYDVHTKNADGLEAYQVLEQKAAQITYSKNKSGALKKKQDQSMIRYLKNYHLPEAVPETADGTKKRSTTKWIVIAVLIAAAAVILVLVITKGNAAKTSETDGATEAVSVETEQVSYNTDSSLEVKDQDTINLDYVGYIDGVAFDGGNTQGNGTDLTIGSGTYIDDFEEQLIGSHPGDQVTVTVTFPEDYHSTELAGQEAVFECVVNGIYE